MAAPRALVLAVDGDLEPGKRALAWVAATCRPTDTLHVAHVATVMSPHVEASSGFVGTRQDCPKHRSSMCELGLTRQCLCSYETHQGSLQQAQMGVDAARAFLDSNFKQPCDAVRLRTQVQRPQSCRTCSQQAIPSDVSCLARCTSLWRSRGHRHKPWQTQSSRWLPSVKPPTW